MSYSFTVPTAQPTEALLRDAGANHKALGPGEARGWIAWRGRFARGVFVFEQDGHAHFKLPVMASRDDAALAKELAVRLARSLGLPIDAEEPPEEIQHSDKTAPAAPEGYEGVFLFRPEEIERWPVDWHDQSQGLGGVSSILRQFNAGKVVLLSGPHRRTTLGETTIARLLVAAPAAKDPASLLQGVIGVLEESQLPGVAALSVCSRYLTNKAPKGATWSPDPRLAQVPAFALQGDVQLVEPSPRKTWWGKRSAGHCTVVPEEGGRYLLPFADFIGMSPTGARVGGDEAVLERDAEIMHFASFRKALKDRFRRIEEFTAIVDGPGRQEFGKRIDDLR